MPDADGEAEDSKRQPQIGNAGVSPANEPSANKPLPKSSSKANTSISSKRSNEVSRARNISDIDTDEMMATIREVFTASDPLDQETAGVEVARALGFRRAGNRIREGVQSALRTAVKRHIVYREKDVYGIECQHIGHYTRDELIQTLLAAIGSTWWDRSDAIRAAARRLGFRRTGTRITKAFKSVINGAIRRGFLESKAQSIRRMRSQ